MLALCDHEDAAEGKQRLAVCLGRIGCGHALGECFDKARSVGRGKSGEKRTKRGAAHEVHHRIFPLEHLKVNGPG